MIGAHPTADEYASHVLGSPDSPDQDLLRAHLRDNCLACREEMKDALEFWYIFASLTERTQDMSFPEPTPVLRQRVIGIARRFGRQEVRTRKVPTWLRIAAGILVTAGAASMSWNIARYQIKRDISVVQARADQQAAGAKKLESENNALRNLVAAARNAPAVFPGRDAIVSVQDPYLLRDLQQARQTQAAAADALNEERAKVADLQKRLSQTTVLLAAATRDKEETDRQYRKAFDAAARENEQGASRFTSEIVTFHAKVQDLESQVAHYRAAMEAQSKGIEKHLQLVSLLEARHVSLVQLRAAGADQTRSGVALIADDLRLAFFPSNLPAAPAGRTYQLWLIRDKGPVSVGTFYGGAEMPFLQFSSKQLLPGIKGLTVTEEPAGGSPLPTGQKILAGTAPKD